ESDGGACYTQNAIGDVVTPHAVQTARFSDADIRRILTVGLQETRGVWRQSRRRDMVAPATAVVFNQFDDTIGWSSDQCGDDGRTFRAKSLITDQFEWNEDVWRLSAQAWALPWTDLTTGDNSGNCSCAANGWSNSSRSSCGDAVWDADCENGPSLTNNCSAGEERANLVLWA